MKRFTLISVAITSLIAVAAFAADNVLKTRNAMGGTTEVKTDQDKSLLSGDVTTTTETTAKDRAGDVRDKRKTVVKRSKKGAVLHKEHTDEKMDANGNVIEKSKGEEKHDSK